MGAIVFVEEDEGGRKDVEEKRNLWTWLRKDNLSMQCLGINLGISTGAQFYPAINTCIYISAGKTCMELAPFHFLLLQISPRKSDRAFWSIEVRSGLS